MSTTRCSALVYNIMFIISYVYVIHAAESSKRNILQYTRNGSFTEITRDNDSLISIIKNFVWCVIRRAIASTKTLSYIWRVVMSVRVVCLLPRRNHTDACERYVRAETRIIDIRYGSHNSLKFRLIFMMLYTLMGCDRPERILSLLK